MDQLKLAIFGPQTTVPQQRQLDVIRNKLLGLPELEVFAAAIEELEELWLELVEFEPRLSALTEHSCLQPLKTWLNTGVLKLPNTSETQLLPNTFLTALTVIIQTTEYFDYLSREGISHEQFINESLLGDSHSGLCTGLLTSTALSVSISTREVMCNIAVALRLAVVLGAYVDLDTYMGESSWKSYVIRWKHANEEQTVLELLGAIPSSYVTVFSDANQITITVDEPSTPTLLSQLSEIGVMVRELAFGGRFHTPAHADAAKKIKTLCESDIRFQFQIFNIESSSAKGSPYERVINAILLEPVKWYAASQGFLKRATQHTSSGPVDVLSFGLVDTFPRSLLKSNGLQLIKPWGNDPAFNEKRHEEQEPPYNYPDDAIAVIGFDCCFPQSGSISEYWDLLLSGSSVSGTIPSDRFRRDDVVREVKGKDNPFFVSPLDDPFAFDHHFFNRSSRESASMDPQQKLVLQVAYRALEMSGYFSQSSTTRDVGCYVGVATGDYDEHVSSHTPTAFSAIGTLRAFIAGKISHFFGFEGPSMVLDTACSGSAVAIHTACNAIRMGECTMALAGGVNVICSPTMHQNLAAANFLSPTGGCKTFDARADGYLRGEGAGLLVLKRLGTARADGDAIFGVLAGSATNQNQNCVPITVPVEHSQAILYDRVLRQTSLAPSAINYVEAHGTGTPKGDPIEMSGIIRTFGGISARKLYIGSVKGAIGHTEAASGVASIIKVLLMMHHRKIPPQANFKTLNPSILPLDQANAVIARSVLEWKSNFLAACVNNYGASGNNAAIVVCQPPECVEMPAAACHSNLSYPIRINAKSAPSLHAYVKALETFINQQNELELSSIAHELARRMNPSLPYSFTGTYKSKADLCLELRKFDPQVISAQTVSIRNYPVILVFSGQTGNTINFPKTAYDSFRLLQNHVDECDALIQSMGLEPIVPRIFSSAPYEDVIQLHCAAFSMQYAYAKAWLDAGLDVTAVVGHSFGELTALCVAGAWSLEDGLKLTAGRARLISEKWGPESGCMLALDVDQRVAETLVTESKEKGMQVEIACYNAADKHVLVGSRHDIDMIESSLPHKSIRGKKLAVTHGFHSRFVDSILPDYRALLESLDISKPRITVDNCSASHPWSHVGPAVVAQQSRRPVYFKDAIHRVRAKHGACAWLEAGVNTSAIPLVRNALKDFQHDNTIADVMIPVKMGDSNSTTMLSEITTRLWSSGARVKFWPFHESHFQHRPILDMPSYQFQRQRHMLEYKSRLRRDSTNHGTGRLSEKPKEMVSLAGGPNGSNSESVFIIDQEAQPFPTLVKGHKVLENALCPASLYIEIAFQCITLISPESLRASAQMHVDRLSMSSPLGLDPKRKILATLEPEPGPRRSWKFQLKSAFDRNDSETHHASARIISDESKTSTGLARFQHLIRYDACESMLRDPTLPLVQGPLIYRLFARVVDYAPSFRGIQSVSGGHDQAVGLVRPSQIEILSVSTLTAPLVVDNFIQVVGFNLNALQDCEPEQVYICSHIEEIRLPLGLASSEGSWLVFSGCISSTKREKITDIYVFDTATRTMVGTILGCQFTKTSAKAMRHVLQKVNGSLLHPIDTKRAVPTDNQKSCELSDEGKHMSVTSSLRSMMADILHDIADIPYTQITDDMVLSSAGIDSLMATELASAIRDKFDVELSLEEFGETLDFASLCEAIDQNRIQSSSSESSTDGIKTPIIATPKSGLANISSPLIGKLETIVAQTLDLTVPIAMGTNLFSAGMDSLLAIELSADIQRAFGGVDINVLTLGEDCVFQNLVEKVFPETVPVLPIQLPNVLDVTGKYIQQASKSSNQVREAPRLATSETVQFHEVNGLQLHADVYYPQTEDEPNTKRPVALMIHGGGHVLLTRADVRPPQTALLLASGFIPVSIDYRLCPEVTLLEGPMVDVCMALEWCRTKLPSMQLSRPDINPDGERVVVVGWSTGGTLAMSLAFTAPARNFRPPDAILAFYSPSVYEDEFWRLPNHPNNTSPEHASQEYDLTDCVQERPIVGHTITRRSPIGGWLSMSDPRARLVLHMNWHGQTLPMLLHGVPTKSQELGGAADSISWKRNQPDPSDVEKISPYAQILEGSYKTPTFFVHGTEDGYYDTRWALPQVKIANLQSFALDLVPWKQSDTVYRALIAKGVASGIEIVEGGQHLFDLRRDQNGEFRKAVLRGYEFLCQQLGLKLSTA